VSSGAPLCVCRTRGCVGCTQKETQVEVANRPGLSRVSYRTGGYTEYRTRLEKLLGEAEGLPELTTRDPDDFTVGLIDGVACLAEVLTFYSERLVNESYLGTALDRVSLAEMGKLVGYRLRPGVAATTHLAFHVEPPPRQEVLQATTPFQRMRQPSSVTIEAGTAVRSVPGPGEQQQTFETAERLEARPEWNLLRPLPTRKTVVGNGAKAVVVKGIATGLRAGDQLLFYAGLSHWETRPVERVAAATEASSVTWQQALTKAAPMTPYVFRKRLAVFGHNAPMWRTMSQQFRDDYEDDDDNIFSVTLGVGLLTGFKVNNWPRYTITPGGVGMAVDVDGSHPEIAVGSRVMLALGAERGLFGVSKVEELSRSEFSVSGKATRVYLTGDAASYQKFEGHVRETTVFAVDERLDLVEEPDPTKVTGGQITVAGQTLQFPAGRTLLVTSPAGSQLVEVKNTLAGGGNTVVTLTETLQHQHVRGEVAIFGNVARATHGETVHQILGDGNAGPFQRFELKHAPLTYVPSEDPSGAASTLEVRVNEVLWHEVRSQYGSGPDERGFVTRQAPGGEVVVGAGDGKRGARVPTGQHNVRAKYRKGIGVAGNLPSGALSQLASPPLGVTGVTNPVPARGGADPDTAEQARGDIPRSTRTLGRAVSVTDYADYARTFAGVTKSHVAVLPVRNVRTIVVTVASADQGNLAGDALCARLAGSLGAFGDPLAPVLVVPHRPAWFDVALKVLADPEREWETVRGAVAQALNEAFGFAARDFTVPVRKSEVIAVAHRAVGVIAVDLDVLTRNGDGQVHELLLAGGSEASKQGQVSGAELLLMKPVQAAAIGKMP
jgi:hypothetical protein